MFVWGSKRRSFKKKYLTDTNNVPYFHWWFWCLINKFLYGVNSFNSQFIPLGKFGGLSNKAPVLERLHGAVFAAPLNTEVNRIEKCLGEDWSLLYLFFIFHLTCKSKFLWWNVTILTVGGARYLVIFGGCAFCLRRNEQWCKVYVAPQKPLKTN